LILKLTLKTKPLNLCRLQRSETNHYATLGLDRQCTLTQIRAAYRVLARQHHPDLNPDSPSAVKRTQELNAAYETLSDAEKRAAHDLELETPGKPSPARRGTGTKSNVSQDLNLRFEELFRGTTREVTVHDPANPDGPEIYELEVPPGTATGTRFRLPRHGPFAGGFVEVRVKAQPTFQFKVRGCDVRCDLKIKPERAAQGGTEMIRGVMGNPVRVPIPRGVGRNEIIRIPGEGLPKSRGDRGDLLVRITYRVAVRFARASAR
jgi:curved DNA-binding protein